jgi:hypothetical protein
VKSKLQIYTEQKLPHKKHGATIHIKHESAMHKQQSCHMKGPKTSCENFTKNENFAIQREHTKNDLKEL